ncbi:MAG TPA: DinB family protein [Ktedonobacterales bacterium]|nr:DinB family protein [Ktedonobacterales bacterium]
MTARSLSTEQVLALLTAAPARIAALTADLAPNQLRTPPAPDEWSANEVLAHLRACADVWGGCVMRMLAEDTPTLRAINPRAWIERTDYPTLDFQTSLRAFTDQRAELLSTLEPLPPEAWSRGATVTGAGKPLRRTVFSYAEWLATHERPHLKQIERIARTVRA